MNRCAQIGQEFILHEFQHRLKQHSMVGVFVLLGWLLKGRFRALSQCLWEGLEGLIFQLLFPPDISCQTNPRWWSEWELFPILSYIPLLAVVLVWKTMEPLGARALLEEVGHWRWALRFYSLASLPVLLLVFASWGNEISLLPDWARSHFCYSTLLMMVLLWNWKLN